MSLVVSPVTLEGRIVRLEPASTRHAEDLARHCAPGTFDLFTRRPKDGSAEAMREFIEWMNDNETILPFAVVLRGREEAVGMTTYLDIRPEHLGLEIGFTWYAPECRGTKVNPECKLLLLEHAFDRLGCIRVQLKTDGRNLHSQAAIRKLGAVYEGTLRKHLVMPDGYQRDTVLYSIIREEWPEVKERLLARVS